MYDVLHGMGTRLDESKHSNSLALRQAAPSKAFTDDGRGNMKTPQLPMHVNKRYACNVEWGLDTKSIIQREIEEVKEKVKEVGRHISPHVETKTLLCRGNMWPEGKLCELDE